MQNKGFTLIELLVVIAIIGILAGIIVVSMGSAQGAARDAKAEAGLYQLRTNAQMYYITNGNYGTNTSPATSAACAATGTMAIITASPKGFYDVCDSMEVKPTVNVAGASGAPGTAWCAYVPSKKVTTEYLCVDSSGVSGRISATTTCDGSTALCGTVLPY